MCEAFHAGKLIKTAAMKRFAKLFCRPFSIATHFEYTDIKWMVCGGQPYGGLNDSKFAYVW